MVISRIAVARVACRPGSAAAAAGADPSPGLAPPTGPSVSHSRKPHSSPAALYACPLGLLHPSRNTPICHDRV